MTISEINAHLEEIYGLTFSVSQISRITDRVFEEIDNWKNSPLKNLRIFSGFYIFILFSICFVNFLTLYFILFYFIFDKKLSN